MLDKLEAIYTRYQEIEQQMNDPQVTGDMKRFVKLSKDYKDLQPVVKAYHDYKGLLDTIAEFMFSGVSPSCLVFINSTILSTALESATMLMKSSFNGLYSCRSRISEFEPCPNNAPLVNTSNNFVMLS